MVVAQKNLLGMAMVVEMLRDARAAAEALLEGIRNEAGECGACYPVLHTHTRISVVVLLPGAKILVTISTSLA